MTETKVCPRCEEPYRGYPALSRRDNKTDICSNCGNEEALNDFTCRRDIPIESIAREYKFQKKLKLDFSDWLKWKKKVDNRIL